MPSSNNKKTAHCSRRRQWKKKDELLDKDEKDYELIIDKN